MFADPLSKDKKGGMHMSHGQNDRYKQYKERIKNLTIMSDAFMRNVLKDQRCTEYILQVIMEKKHLKVREQTLQADYKNLRGRSAILDCVAQDWDGQRYAVEIQQASEGAHPKRARYYRKRQKYLPFTIAPPGDAHEFATESCCLRSANSAQQTTKTKIVLSFAIFRFDGHEHTRCRKRL